MLCCLLCGAPLGADELKVGTEWPELQTISGKRFWNVRFTFVSPGEVRFMHTAGVGSMPPTELRLPPDVSIPGWSDDGRTGPLEAMMTEQERKSSGVDKLSPREQAALARWLQRTVGDLIKQALEKPALPASPGRTPPAPGAAAAPSLGASATPAVPQPATPATPAAEPAAAAPAAPAPAMASTSSVYLARPAAPPAATQVPRPPLLPPAPGAPAGR